jgi:Tfp pilus assembly protein PilO
MKFLPAIDLRRWWNQRPRREQLMIGLCALGAVAALGDTLVIAPLEKKIRQAQARHSGLSARWQESVKVGLVQRAKQAQTQDQESQLRARLQAAQVRVGALNAKLQDSAQLPQLLRAITATVGSAKLLELQVADDPSFVATANPGPAAEAVKTAEAATAPATTAASTAAAHPVTPARRLYRLPMTLKVSGNWNELGTLLTQIERHADALQWTSLTLDSSAWPAIELTLKAHVLSLQPRWGATT